MRLPEWISIRRRCGKIRETFLYLFSKLISPILTVNDGKSKSSKIISGQQMIELTMTKCDSNRVVSVHFGTHDGAPIIIIRGV